MAEPFRPEDIIRAAALLTDTAYLQKFLPILRPDEFKQPELRWLSKVLLEYAGQHKSAPTFEVLQSLLNNDLRLKADEKEIIAPYITKMQEHKPKLKEQEYYKDILERFIQHQYLSRLVREVSRLNGENRADEAEALLRDTRMPKSSEVDLVFAPKDIDKLFEADTNIYIPTGISALDEIVKGLAPGEEGVVMAPTGYGKSMALVHFGAHAWRKGYNVVHFSFENSKEETMARYVSNMSHIPTDLLREEGSNSSLVKTAILKAESLGSQVAITRQIGRVTDVDKVLADLYAILDQYEFEPDLLILDYGDLMRPVRSGKNRYEDMQAVFTEIRDLAIEINLPVWTATQTNREGAEAKRVKISHVAESFGKAMTADLIISLSRPDKDEALDTGSDGEITGDVAEFRVLKLRRGAEGHTPALVRTNFAYARFDEIDAFEEQERLLDQAASQIKRKLRNGNGH